MKKYFFILLCFVVLFSACHQQYGKINGTVTNQENQPLVNVLVVLKQNNSSITKSSDVRENNQITYTDANGYYEFENLFEGEYQVEVITDDCGYQIKPAEVFECETTIVDFELECENNTNCVLPNPLAFYTFSGDTDDISGNNPTKILDNVSISIYKYDCVKVIIIKKLNFT